MTINALLLGSIGVVTDTSDMQRRAFNEAFKAAGLDWHWDEAEYRNLLKSSGGRGRVADYADARGQSVDAEAIHADKVARFARMMMDDGLRLRPGLRVLIDQAANRALPVAWVTDTSEEQLSAHFEAFGPALRPEEFAWIGADKHIDNRKPAPDIYLAALTDLRVAPDQAIAIEDTGICAQAALAAGIRTFGWPNSYADRQDFPAGVKVVERVEDLLDRIAEPTG